MKYKIIISTIFSVVTTAVIGDWSETLTVLLIMQCADILTGLLISFIGKSEKSNTGYVSSKSFFTGIIKKCLQWALICIGFQADVVLNIDITKNAVSYWLIASEGLSIIENVGNTGINIPILAKVFEKIKGKGDANEH